MTLFNVATLNSFFTESDPTRCLVNRYQIFHSSNDSLAIEGEELYAVLNLGSRDETGVLQVQTDVEATDGTVVSLDYSFKIKGLNDGESSADKSVSLSITVCGYETLTATSGVETYENLFVANSAATTESII